ncbi:hypothetical protein [Halorussus halophilus]|uniref:hypothetical protein n=1 Tax=Halorussus halophilus TaxID=2650975 RepID=UPI001CE47742|nr:hypothetical protein [Halorussus halophilus]
MARIVTLLLVVIRAMGENDAEADDEGENANEEFARMELEPDAWHETEAGYYLDCPECGSPATLDNVIEKGRCNAYLGDQRDWMEVDVSDLSCTAKLRLELAYTSDE